MNQESIPTARAVGQTQAGQATQGASGRAIATLILGILAIASMGFLTGIPAIVIGHIELKAIKLGQAPKAGEGLARVGLILGIIGTVLTCLALLVVISLLALGISIGTSQFMTTSV